MKYILMFLPMGLCSITAGQGWERLALNDVVLVLSEVVSLHTETTSIFLEAYASVGIPGFSRLRAFTVYKDLFGSCLHPTFVQESLSHANVVIPAIHEAVSDAKGDTQYLIDALIRITSRTRFRPFVDVGDSLITRWSNVHMRLGEIRGNHGISPVNVLPVSVSPVVDKSAEKYFEDLLTLFAYFREILADDFQVFATFRDTVDSSSALLRASGVKHVTKIVRSVDQAISRSQAVRALEFRNGLDDMLEDTGRFKIFLEDVSKGISDLHLMVNSSTEATSVVPVFISEFQTHLEQMVLPKWKRLRVEVGVLEHRVRKEIGKRASGESESLATADQAKVVEREMKMAALIDVLEKQEGGSVANFTTDGAPTIPALCQVQIIDSLSKVAVLLREDQSMIQKSFAQGGLYGQQKFEGFRILGNLLRHFFNPEFTAPGKNISFHEIAIAHELASDAALYVDTLFMELIQLEFVDTKQFPQVKRIHMARWTEEIKKLAGLRERYGIPMARYLPAQNGLYIPDHELNECLREVLKMFKTTRDLLSATYFEILEVHKWAQANSRQMEKIMGSSIEVSNFMSNLTFVMDDFKQVRQMELHEDLKLVAEEMNKLEEMAISFTKHVVQLMRYLNTLSLREGTKVEQFRRALSERIYPTWNDCRIAATTMKADINQSLINRETGLSADATDLPYIFGDLEEPESSEAFAELSRIAQEADQSAPSVKPATALRKPKQLKRSPKPGVDASDDLMVATEEAVENLLVSNGNDAAENLVQIGEPLQETEEDFWLGEFQLVKNRREKRNQAQNPKKSADAHGQSAKTQKPAKLEHGKSQALATPKAAVASTQTARVIASSKETVHRTPEVVAPTPKSPATNYKAAVSGIAKPEISRSREDGKSSSIASPTSNVQQPQEVVGPTTSSPTTNYATGSGHAEMEVEAVAPTTASPANDYKGPGIGQGVMEDIVVAPTTMSPATLHKSAGGGHGVPESSRSRQRLNRHPSRAPRVVGTASAPVIGTTTYEDFCLTRLANLAAHSRYVHQEMMHWCAEVTPRLWWAGNIPAAQTAGVIQNMAWAAEGNSATLLNYAAYAMGSRNHQ